MSKRNWDKIQIEDRIKRYGWDGENGRGGPEIDRSMTDKEKERKLGEGQKRKPLPKNKGAYRVYIQKIRAARRKEKEVRIATQRSEQRQLRKKLKATRSSMKRK